MSMTSPNKTLVVIDDYCGLIVSNSTLEAHCDGKVFSMARPAYAHTQLNGTCYVRPIITDGYRRALHTTVDGMLRSMSTFMNAALDMGEFTVHFTDPVYISALGVGGEIIKALEIANTRYPQRDICAQMLFETTDYAGSAIGVAYIASACVFGTNMGIVSTENVRLMSPIVFAHEMGHILGANHNTPACGSGIMNAVIGVGLSTFTECSEQDIYDYVRTVDCLGATVPPDNVSEGLPAWTIVLAVLGSVAILVSGSIAFARWNAAGADHGASKAALLPVSGRRGKRARRGG